MFNIVFTSRFDKSFKKIYNRNTEVKKYFEEMEVILEADPLNISRVHNITKLTDTKPGDGQWRIRKGDWRVRYDVTNRNVILHSFKHRKDAY